MVQRINDSVILGSAALTKKTKESTATPAERGGIEAFDGQRVVQVPWVKNVSTGGEACVV